MAKTRIKHIFKDSAGLLLKGKLVVTLDDTLIEINDEPDSILLPIPHEYLIEDGLVDIELYVSDLSRISYNFEFYQLVDEAVSAIPARTDGLGNILVEGVEAISRVYSESPIYSLRSVIPLSPTPISFASLQPTGINIRTDTSAIYEITAELLRNDNLLNLFNERLFPYKQEFNPDAFYKKGDIVIWEGRQYRYIGIQNKLGIYPSDLTNWAKWGGDKGETGSGISGDNASYNAETWLGSRDAPTKNSIRAVIETLASKVLLNNKASIFSPTFIGNPEVPTAVEGSISKQVVNTEFVNAHYSKKVSPIFIGTPTAPTPTQNTNNNTVATTAFVKNSLTFDNLRADDNVNILFNTFTNVLTLNYVQDGSIRRIEFNYIVNLINNNTTLPTLYQLTVIDSGISEVISLKQGLNNSSTLLNQGNSSGSYNYVPSNIPGTYQIRVVLNKLENSTANNSLVAYTRFLSAQYIK